MAARAKVGRSQVFRLVTIFSSGFGAASLSLWALMLNRIGDPGMFGFSTMSAVIAGLAALAAVLVVPIQQAHYLMGGDPLLLSFIVVIIGGLGSIEGAFIGALLVGLLQNYIAFLEPKLALISNIGLMTAILMWRPQGMMPGVEAKGC